MFIHQSAAGVSWKNTSSATRDSSWGFRKLWNSPSKIPDISGQPTTSRITQEWNNTLADYHLALPRQSRIEQASASMTQLTAALTRQAVSSEHISQPALLTESHRQRHEHRHRARHKQRHPEQETQHCKQHHHHQRHHYHHHHHRHEQQRRQSTLHEQAHGVGLHRSASNLNFGDNEEFSTIVPRQNTADSSTRLENVTKRPSTEALDGVCPSPLYNQPVAVQFRPAHRPSSCVNPASVEPRCQNLHFGRLDQRSSQRFRNPELEPSELTQTYADNRSTHRPTVTNETCAFTVKRSNVNFVSPRIKRHGGRECCPAQRPGEHSLTLRHTTNAVFPHPAQRGRHVPPTRIQLGLITSPELGDDTSLFGSDAENQRSLVHPAPVSQHGGGRQHGQPHPHKQAHQRVHVTKHSQLAGDTRKSAVSSKDTSLAGSCSGLSPASVSVTDCIDYSNTCCSSGSSTDLLSSPIGSLRSYKALWHRVAGNVDCKQEGRRQRWSHNRVALKGSTGAPANRLSCASGSGVASESVFALTTSGGGGGGGAGGGGGGGGGASGFGSYRESVRGLARNYASDSVSRRLKVDAADRLIESQLGVVPTGAAAPVKHRGRRKDHFHLESLHTIARERIRINVSGMHFETRRAVLDSHPTTLLGNPSKRERYFDASRKEYFFDRHRPSFEAIFNYFQYGGKLKRPDNVPDEIFLSELQFYELETAVLDGYKRDEGYIQEDIILPTGRIKRMIWMLFEFPETSQLAFVISIFSIICTITSIVLFCVETLPSFSKTHCEDNELPNFADTFFLLETFCTGWFTIEIVIRFAVCPSRRAFALDMKNAVDVAAIVPYYFTLANVLITFSCSGAKSSASLAFLRVIRLVRIFKLTKHSSGLQVLILTFRASLESLGVFLVALIVLIILFSSTLYYVEADRRETQIESIPDAFWWAITTMCTVGYGDKVPKTPWGKFVGSICALSGVLAIAIPVPIITENFNKFYAHKTGRMRI